MNTPVRAFLRKTDRRNQDENATLLTLSEYWGVDIRANRTTDEARADSLVGYKEVCPDDLVMNIMLAWKGAQAISSFAGVISPAYEIYEPDQTKVVPRYLHYLMRSKPVVADMASRSYGIMASRLRLYWDRFKEMWFDLPSLETQQSIADLLDQDTEGIDSGIRRLEAAKQLVEEKRRAVAVRLLTGEESNGGKTKIVGLDWLPRVPSSWDVIRTRFLCQVTTGSGDTQDAVPGGEYPFFVRSPNVERSESYSFEGEGVMTSGDGAGVGKIFHHFTGKFHFHQRVYLFHSFQRVSGRYFYHFLREMFAAVALAGNAKSTVDSLRRPMLLDFPIAVPPADQQEEILSKLESLERATSHLVSLLDQQIGLLEERRQALITHAVTGQLKVPMEAVHA